MNVLTRCWHDVVDTASRFRDFYLNTVDGSIEKMANSINDVDEVVAYSLEIK